MDDKLKHYGTPRHSGRYPWGSGDEAYQRSKSFLSEVEALKKKGLSEVQVAEGLGMTTSELRNKKTLAKAEKRKAEYAEALRLKNKGYSNVAIGERLHMNESSVRSLLNPALQQRSEITKATTNMLRDAVDKKGYIDVGAGVENHIGVSRTKLKTAISALEEEGYKVHYVYVDQLGTGKKTSVMVLGKPDSEYTDVFKNKDKIRMITEFSKDGGRTYLGLDPVKSIDSKRVKIRYAEDGGIDKDGVIELRRGVDDLNLGKSRYAQVRIGVDDNYFLKGMAMYSDDIPDGYDVVFNTNKKKDVPPEKVFKPMKRDKDGNLDQDNPFGSTIKKDVNELGEVVSAQRGVLNIVNEEGDWDKWSKTISSQVLSKQNPSLAKKQLGLAFDVKQEEYNEIMSLTNPAVKKKLLDSFADDCDSAAVHLKAAALPRQGSHVILPFPNMKENEIYAPNYRDGEQVVLIRYPHGGTFEIPELTVNNKNKDAKSVINQARDAVGIHPKVAERLSGADFDGDTVLVIPNTRTSTSPKGIIKTTAPLKGLKDFDPKEMYPPFDGMPTIDGGIWNDSKKEVDYGGKRPKGAPKQMRMGDVSNLITDMTIKGADANEIARAVRHSMVVIDSEKHHLNYKQSYIDNGIAELKARYQGGKGKGASTLISRASSEIRVGDRKERAADPETGKKVYEYTGETYKTKTGKTMLKTVGSTKMAEVDDAFSLSSGTIMEANYATHANKLKALGNQSRKESLTIKPIHYSPSAKVTYAKEVASLNASLKLAVMNKPLERQAQILANTVVAAKKRDNPNMEYDDIKKIGFQALTEARQRVGAGKKLIEISDREWEAIQAGAVSNNTLTQILNNTDLDNVKRLATPRSSVEIPDAKLRLAKARLESGYTQAEVADSLGISTSVLAKVLKD